MLNKHLLNILMRDWRDGRVHTSGVADLITGQGTKGPPLVTQMVMNLPAMLETWVRSLGWEDPLENAWLTHSSGLL